MGSDNLTRVALMRCDCGRILDYWRHLDRNKTFCHGGMNRKIIKFRRGKEPHSKDNEAQ